MRRALLIAFALATLCGAGEERALFNGNNLDGWDGDPRLWSVRDGMIVGSTEGAKLAHNEFLITREQFGDFDLHVEMKLRNHNSGVQFRSEALPDFVVAGYQADAGENNYWGNLYEERGKRGTMVDGWAAGGKDVVDLKGWNTYDIHCQGDHIVIKLNGRTTVDTHDTARLKGVIALQLHMGPPMEADFRNIRIREL